MCHGEADDCLGLESKLVDVDSDTCGVVRHEPPQWREALETGFLHSAADSVEDDIDRLTDRLVVCDDLARADVTQERGLRRRTNGRDHPASAEHRSQLHSQMPHPTRGPGDQHALPGLQSRRTQHTQSDLPATYQCHR